jgi:hypothetical protein
MPRAHHARVLFRPGSWRREVLFLGLLYMVYEWVRGVAPERKGLAFANAERLQQFEQWLRIDIEWWSNQLLVDRVWLANLCSAYYQLAHEAVAAVVLAWLWHRHRHAYPALRSTLVAMTLASLLMYWLVPLAPPRLAQRGFVDTMHVNPVLFAGMDSVTGWVNLYAAMPSVHVAWATWCALAFTLASRSSRRWLSWAYPTATSCVVLGTGNHYLLDIVVGVLVVFVASWTVEAIHPDRRNLGGGVLRS